MNSLDAKRWIWVYIHANIVVKSPSNDMLQNKSFTGEFTENFVHQSPRGNMHKLLDCIRTALKRFLACLTFHRKEIRLRHLYKRTKPGSAPGYNYIMFYRRRSVFYTVWLNSKIFSHAAFLTYANYATHAELLWTHAIHSIHAKIWPISPTLFSRLSNLWSFWKKRIYFKCVYWYV